jgi:hypothetical protein
MTLTGMSESETEVVRRAIEATFDYFTLDYETRIGVEPQRVRELLERWPEVDDTEDDSDACLVINNSLNDLLHGEGISDRESVELTGLNSSGLYEIYRKWADARGWKSTGVR